MKKIICVVIMLQSVFLLFGQGKKRICGYVVDSANVGIEFVNVKSENLKSFATTNQSGYYEITTDSKDSLYLVFSRVGYSSARQIVYPLRQTLQKPVVLKFLEKQIKEISIVGQRRQTDMLDKIDPSKLRLMPNASGGIESILTAFAGVNSSNELSSQYNVRGGSFDENAVYVNGIEIYRPLLVRAGQQEGLSFVNRDMVKSLSFSSGGFDAKYGDKMSSVLDIEYKKPSQFEDTLTVGLLGSSAYFGNATRRFTQMHGVRYKSVRSLLQTLDTKAEYLPTFVDYQTYLTYELKPNLEISFLGNFSQNSYSFIPQSRSTSFGTYNTGRNLMVYFEGQEADLFRTAFGALSLNYKPRRGVKLSLQASSFNTSESETYDILGEYVLSEVKMDLNAENKKGEVLGIGKYHEHARNRLNATVSNLAHQGEWLSNGHRMNWGLTLQNELIRDKMNEWEWRDSAGYSIPRTEKPLFLYYSIKSENTLSTWRTLAYWQDSYKWNSNAGEFTVTGGLRANFWTFNKEFLISPRLSGSFQPAFNRDFLFRLATGIYYQAPFYKEIRQITSDSLHNSYIRLNKNIKSPRSYQVVAGGDYYFRLMGRPFKFTTEAYLKLADRIIAYSVDNVRIRYSGENNAKAYSTGVDFRLSGELVPDAESWINVSLMDSREDLYNDSFVQYNFDSKGNILSQNTVYPGYLPRPNEQRYAFKMFFKDYWPNNPKYKLHLAFTWADGLPMAAPRNTSNSVAFRATGSRSPAYRRVDMGVSRELISGQDKLMEKRWLKHVKCIWLDAEILNLMGFKNVNSYYWVSDVGNTQWAVPNYLTGRQLNIKVIMSFK